MKHAPFHQADAVEQRRMGMAECGWRGLSDGWMLRHLGDLHWRLIAVALGQQTTIFAAAEGAPVYAAFCVISERILHPARARPGAMMTIAARLRRLSPKRLVSFHHLSIGETLFAEVTMITAFVRHGEASGNAHLPRAQPQGHLDLLPMAPGADRGFVDQAARLYRGWAATEPLPRHEVDVTPVPTTDFNAAGLLVLRQLSRAGRPCGMATAP